MSKQYHYAIVFDDELNRWEIDIDTEESAFPNGTIYDTESREWEYGYAGDGVFTGREEELMSELDKFLNAWNQRLKTGEN